MAAWRRYDELVVGSVFPEQPVEFAVTAEVAAGYRAIAEQSLLPQGAPPAEGDAVPPSLAALYIRGAQNALRGPPGGVHAKQHFTFLRPVRIGDTLHTSLTIADKYERNGRRYVVSETMTRDAAGAEITRGRITSIWGQEP